MGENGVDLTDTAGGVAFDLAAIGCPQQTAWTAPDSDDAWLVLDRDNSGFIEDGTELFGSATAQPEPPPGNKRNGFLALAVFDLPENGGNNSGFIDPGDSFFLRLRLWQDVNHDGVTQAAELKMLSDADIGRIDLEYRMSRRVDSHGNLFRYRARLWDVAGRLRGWAWDVILVGSSCSD